MFTDLYLRADSESALAVAMPWFRREDAWVTASHHHALDLIGPITTTPAILDENGEVVTPAMIDGRYHANLRLFGDHPDREAILAGLEAVRIDPEPATPSRVWA